MLITFFILYILGAFAMFHRAVKLTVSPFLKTQLIFKKIFEDFA